MLFAIQLPEFSVGSKLEIVNASFRGIGFGGSAVVVAFDADHLELALRVTKLLFHIEVVLRFGPAPDGKVSFYGGRPDGKKTGNEPAHVKHTMEVKVQTAERTTFAFEFDDQKGNVSIREVTVEKARVKGVDGMRLTYDRYALTLLPKR